MANTKKLKKGLRIFVKEQHPKVYLSEEQTWEVDGFNYSAGEQTYRFLRENEDGRFSTTHDYVKHIDEAIESGHIEIIKRKR